MLTDKELEWLRHSSVQHICNNCWWHHALQYESFKKHDAYTAIYVDNEWYMTAKSRCDNCMHKTYYSNHEDNWDGMDCYAWDDDTHTKYHMTETGLEAQKKRNRQYKSIFNWADAAEFEARVAARVAMLKHTNSCNLCPMDGEEQCLKQFRARFKSPCCSDVSIAWLNLKRARLAVEEEMGNDRA